MRKLQDTLYILTPDSYIYHRNENVCISIGGVEKASCPATQIASIVFVGKNSFSTPFLGFCGEKGITVTFLDEHGRFYGRLCGPVSGNVLLRKKQYASLDDTAFATQLVQHILFGKFRNSRDVLMRHARTLADTEKGQQLYHAAEQIRSMAEQLLTCTEIDSMRGIEGAAASVYFSQFDNMLSPSCSLRFETRSKHPPRNAVNAVLSFVYSMLTKDICAAAETVGLDPAAGYLHTLRPGRPSLALDLIEELRAPLCDSLTLTLCNKGQLSEKDFDTDADAVYLNDKGRRTVVKQWRERKREEILHPFFQEKIPIGLIPFTQAMLLARVLRGDLDMYPPFVWR